MRGTLVSYGNDAVSQLQVSLQGRDNNADAITTHTGQKDDRLAKPFNKLKKKGKKLAKEVAATITGGTEETNGEKVFTQGKVEKVGIEDDQADDRTVDSASQLQVTGQKDDRLAKPFNKLKKKGKKLAKEVAATITGGTEETNGEKVF